MRIFPTPADAVTLSKRHITMFVRLQGPRYAQKQAGISKICSQATRNEPGMGKNTRRWAQYGQEQVQISLAPPETSRSQPDMLRNKDIHAQKGRKQARISLVHTKTRTKQHNTGRTNTSKLFMMVPIHKRASFAQEHPKNSLGLRGTGRNEPVICKNKE